MSLRDIAIKALEKKSIKPTEEKINSVVASLRLAKVDLSDEKAITASADFAVNSSMKFDGVSLFKKIQQATQKKAPEVQESTKTNFCGLMCPRCGKPLVYAHIEARDVGYCTNGCNIAVPFPKE